MSRGRQAATSQRPCCQKCCCSRNLLRSRTDRLANLPLPLHADTGRSTSLLTACTIQRHSACGFGGDRLPTQALIPKQNRWGGGRSIGPDHPRGTVFRQPGPDLR